MQTASNEATPVTSEDVMDIDGPCFDADAYLDMLMNREGMDELVRHNRQLQREVQKYDGQMKKLVHDNYQNFIAATDTTHQMKERVADMDEEMARLRAGMESLDSLSQAVETTLAQHRATVEHLSDVSRLLESRQFLFELPQRLTAAVELGAYAQAVQYYHRTAGILRKYNHLSSFQQILDACEHTVEQLRDRLRSIVANEETPSSEVTENIRLLLDLNESPARLRDEFLQRRGRHIEQALAEFEQMVSTLQEAAARQDSGSPGSPLESSGENVEDGKEAAPEDVTQSSDVVSFISELNMSFLSSLLEVIQGYRALFMSASRSTTSQRAAAVDLDAFVEKLFSSFLGITRSRLDCCTDAAQLIRALEVLHRNLGNMAIQVPSLNAIERGERITGATLQQHIESSYFTLQADVDRAIENLAKVASLWDSAPGRKTEQREADPSGTIQLASRSIELCVRRYIRGLRPLASLQREGPSGFLGRYREGLIVKLSVKLQQLFLYLSDISEQERLIDTSHTALLMCARVFLNLERTGVRRTHAMLEDSSVAAAEHFNVEAVRSQLQTATQALLSRYVTAQGSKVSQLLYKGIQLHDWLHLSKAPRAVRPAMDVVLRQLFELADVIQECFGDSPPRHRRTASHTSFDIRRIEASRITSSTIINGVVALVLRSFCECVRQQTFSECGFQQIQVDAYYTALVLPHLSDDSAPLLALQKRVLESAAERALLPTSLPQSIVEKICRPKYDKAFPQPEESKQEAALQESQPIA